MLVSKNHVSAALVEGNYLNFCFIIKLIHLKRASGSGDEALWSIYTCNPSRLDRTIVRYQKKLRLKTSEEVSEVDVY